MGAANIDRRFNRASDWRKIASELRHHLLVIARDLLTTEIDRGANKGGDGMKMGRVRPTRKSIDANLRLAIETRSHAHSCKATPSVS